MIETRKSIIERIKRLVYGEQVSDDANITDNLVNQYLTDAIGIVAKTNYIDSIKLDGVAYVNNAFYTTFKNIAITEDEPLVYKIALPSFPIGIGRNEGIASLRFKDSDGHISLDAIPLNINQVSYSNSLPKAPNKVYYYNIGDEIFVETPIDLYNYTAIIRMISGSDSESLSSVLNVPSEYLQQIIEYVSKLLMMSRQMPQDDKNDGRDG